MSYEVEEIEKVANELPSDFDNERLSDTIKNPTELFRMLDLNNDGRVTKEDLKLLLEKFGIKSAPAKVLASFIFKQLDADKSGTIEPTDLIHANGIITKLLKMKGKQN